MGVAGVMSAIGSGTELNDESARLTQAGYLAQEIREWTLSLPFSEPDSGDEDNPPGSDGASPQVWVDDLDDLMGVTYKSPVTPPMDGSCVPVRITNLPDWSQTINMSWRSPNNVQTEVTPGTSDVVFVQVSIAYKGTEILNTGWIVTRKTTDDDD
jgi:hypothetical protein